MAGLVNSFQSEESNSMLAESMKDYVLASIESAYEDPGEQAPMVFTAAGGGFQDVNYSHRWDQKHPSFPGQAFSNNSN